MHSLEGIDPGEHVLEIGPGPGRTTEILREMAPHLTALEVDEDLATALAERLAGTDVEVVQGDATHTAFPSGHFTSVLSFTMLHHVPSAELQDQLFVETARILRPDGWFAGVDSFDSPEFRDLHAGDICVPVPPDTLRDRLLKAGFSIASVDSNPYQFRFRARR
jgi:ubiquinone/menaquinone biosynthesis C-methylase UbiE